MVRSEGFLSMKNSLTAAGLDPATTKYRDKLIYFLMPNTLYMEGWDEIHFLIEQCLKLKSSFLLSDEMGVACGTYGRQVSCMQGFGGETWGERANIEYKGVEGSIILKWILKKWIGDMDWIDLAQDKDR